MGFKDQVTDGRNSGKFLKLSIGQLLDLLERIRVELTGHFISDVG